MFGLSQAKQLLLNKFGGLYTEAPPNNLPPGASPQTWDVDFLIAGVGTRPGLTNPISVFSPAITNFPVEYIKSTEVLGPTNLTLVEDGGVNLYQENLLNQGTFLQFYGPILNLARATSETVNQREYIALSDFLQGTDQPRQYDGTNLDRISQVGPGQAPSTTVTAPTYPIDTITEIYSPVDIDSISWGASINLYHAQPASTNLYFLSAVGATHFTDNLEIGTLVFITVGAILVEGIDPGGTYAVTFIGGYSDSDGSRQVFGVTARVSNSDFVRGSAGIKWQRSDALIQLLSPIPLENAVVGGTITVQGASVPQWNRTWKIAQTPTEGQLSITATVLSSNIATYDYVLQSGIAPGWQANFDYPMAAQIVDPNAGDGTVWQITTPGKSGGSIPGFAGSTQVDGTAIWKKQASTTQVLVTVFNTNNGNGIFNIQDLQILQADETSFTVGITSPDISSSAEDGGAASGSGSALIINPGTMTLGTTTDPIYGDATGGNVLVPNPLVAPGKRWVVEMFLTRNGFITPASPPRPFFTTIETGTLTFTNLAIGPEDVIARIVAITLAEAGPGGPYFWIPDDVIVADSPDFLGVSHTFEKTVLEDNSGTTLGPIHLSDAVLGASENISVVGNNLQQERELGECVKVVQYAGRCFYLGERVKNDQFVNLTFDGGSVTLDGTAGMPAGWNVTAGIRADVSLITSQAFGKSLQITGASGFLAISLSSATAFGSPWRALIPLSSMTTLLKEFIVSIGNPLFSPVPDDLRLQVYPTNYGPSNFLDQSAFTTDGLMAPIIQPHTAYSVRVTAAVSGSTLVVDRIEVFPTQQPVYTLQVAASYADNTEAIDGLTGAIDTSILSSQPETNHFIFLNKYFITTRSKTFSPIQSGSGEPDTWSVDEISNAVGCLGPLADDVGEEYTIVADDNGVYVFDGGNHMKISQEIQQIWDYIYKPSKRNVWILNDLKQQRILVGVPLPTPNQWLPNAPTNATPAYPNVILMCSYLSLMNGAEIATGHAVFPSAFTGNLLFHDGKRKWTIWQIPAATAAWVQRADGSEQIWFGQAV